MTQQTQQPRPASSYRGNKPSKAQGRGAFKRALARQQNAEAIAKFGKLTEAAFGAEVAKGSHNIAIGFRAFDGVGGSNVFKSTISGTYESVDLGSTHVYASRDEAFEDVKAGVDAMKRQVEVEETVFNQINERIVSDHNLAAEITYLPPNENVMEWIELPDAPTIDVCDEVSYDEVVSYNVKADFDEAEAKHEAKLARRRELAAAKRLKAKEEYEIAKSYTD